MNEIKKSTFFLKVICCNTIKKKLMNVKKLLLKLKLLELLCVSLVNVFKSGAYESLKQAIFIILNKNKLFYYRFCLNWYQINKELVIGVILV